MSWVLILTPRPRGGTPAIIGGYHTKAEAEAAGLIATAEDLDTPGRGWDWYGFTVIPGAADTPPQGAPDGLNP